MRPQNPADESATPYHWTAMVVVVSVAVGLALGGVVGFAVGGSSLTVDKESGWYLYCSEAGSSVSDDEVVSFWALSHATRDVVTDTRSGERVYLNETQHEYFEHGVTIRYGNGTLSCASQIS